MTKTRTGGRAAPKSGTGRLFVSLVAVVLVGLVGFVGTRAAISDTTDNPGNQFNAGAIDLVDNDAGQYMYQVNNVQPGDSVSQCIRVSYTGTLDSACRASVDRRTRTEAPLPRSVGFAASSYAGSITSTDSVVPPNSGTSNFSTVVDNTAPTRTSASIANGGVAGRMDAGDTIAYVWSEIVDPQSVLSGWTGTSTPVTVQISNVAGTRGDTIAVRDSANSTQLPSARSRRRSAITSRRSRPSAGRRTRPAPRCRGTRRPVRSPSPWDRPTLRDGHHDRHEHGELRMVPRSGLRQSGQLVHHHDVHRDRRPRPRVLSGHDPRLQGRGVL